MYKMNSVWGALIQGDNIALSSLIKKINGSVKTKDDFFISMAGSECILRTSRWDAAPDSATAYAIALKDFLIIVGCLDILERRSGLQLKTIFQFMEDGTIHQTSQATAVLPRNTKAEASSGLFKRLIRAASSHPLGDAISDFRGNGDWYSVYKTFEGLRNHYGDEAKLYAAFPDKKSDLERVRKTANSYRHTPRAFRPLANPIGLNTAKAVLESIFEVIAQAEPYPNSPFPGGQVQLDNYPELAVIWLSDPIVTKT